MFKPSTILKMRTKIPIYIFKKCFNTPISGSKMDQTISSLQAISHWKTLMALYQCIFLWIFFYED